jgi:hypothetical protein
MFHASYCVHCTEHDQIKKGWFDDIEPKQYRMLTIFFPVLKPVRGLSQCQADKVGTSPLGTLQHAREEAGSSFWARNTNLSLEQQWNPPLPLKSSLGNDPNADAEGRKRQTLYTE